MGKIEFDGAEEHINISGKMKNVLAVRTYVETLVSDNRLKKISLSEKELRIVADKPSILAEVELKSGLDLQLSITETEATVAMRGSLSALQEAEDMLAELILDECEQTITIAVPTEQAGILIGKGGSNIKQLQDKFVAKLDLTARPAVYLWLANTRRC